MISDLNSKTIALAAAGGFAVIGMLTYGILSARSDTQTRMSDMERQIQTLQVRNDEALAKMATEMNAMGQKMGLNGQELQNARSLAEQLRQEQQAAAQRLRREISGKADSRALSQFREDASGKIGVVSNDLQTVRTDLDSARFELASGIARNSAEVGELRKRGERDYFEFDIKKSKNLQRVAGDLLMQLKKADVKKQRYDIAVLVDDNTIEEKGRFVNTPLQYLSGRDRVRYEVVVNAVEKDRIRGYVSAPRDRIASTEGPQSRTQLR